MAATVLIGGETGTGKNLVARAIHEASDRCTGPFVHIDCGALPAELVEAEILGYERGAFTGSTERRVGLIEAAHGGTVFIDEMGELPLELQPKLLGVLDNRVVRRVGGREAIPVDVRIIAATHRNLRQMVAEKRFREDLYYRLDVVSFSLPGLRARLQDIAEIVQAYVERHRGPVFSTDALPWLFDNPWPGNVRELYNVLEKAHALARGRVVDRAMLRTWFPAASMQRSAPVSDVERTARHIYDRRIPLPELCAAVHRISVEANGKNITAAAREIGIGRKALAAAVARDAKDRVVTRSAS